MRLAFLASSTEMAINRKGLMLCQFSRLALMEFSSVMLSSEFTDQKQMRNSESFFANSAKVPVLFCSDLSLANWSESCACNLTEQTIRKTIQEVFISLFYPFPVWRAPPAER